MNKYEKPIVMINEELAEGVYAASGATGHWISTEGPKQEGTTSTWRVRFTNSVSGPRSDANDKTVSMELYFDKPINSASEVTGKGIDSISGSTVTVVANYWACRSGEGIDCAVCVADPVDAKCTGAIAYCKH